MKTVLSVKVDKDLKERATRLASDLRMPLSTIINGQLLEFVNTGVFTTSTSLTPNKRLGALIKRARADFKKGKNVASFTNAREAIAFLDTL